MPSILYSCGFSLALQTVLLHFLSLAAFSRPLSSGLLTDEFVGLPTSLPILHNVNSSISYYMPFSSNVHHPMQTGQASVLGNSRNRSVQPLTTSFVLPSGSAGHVLSSFGLVFHPFKQGNGAKTPPWMKIPLPSAAVMSISSASNWTYRGSLQKIQPSGITRPFSASNTITPGIPQSSSSALIDLPASEISHFTIKSESNLVDVSLAQNTSTSETRTSSLPPLQLASSNVATTDSNRPVLSGTSSQLLGPSAVLSSEMPSFSTKATVHVTATMSAEVASLSVKTISVYIVGPSSTIAAVAQKAGIVHDQSKKTPASSPKADKSGLTTVKRGKYSAKRHHEAAVLAGSLLGTFSAAATVAFFPRLWHSCHVLTKNKNAIEDLARLASEGSEVAAGTAVGLGGLAAGAEAAATGVEGTTLGVEGAAAGSGAPLRPEGAGLTPENVDAVDPKINSNSKPLDNGKGRALPEPEPKPVSIEERLAIEEINDFADDVLAYDAAHPGVVDPELLRDIHNARKWPPNAAGPSRRPPPGSVLLPGVYYPDPYPHPDDVISPESRHTTQLPSLSSLGFPDPAPRSPSTLSDGSDDMPEWGSASDLASASDSSGSLTPVSEGFEENVGTGFASGLSRPGRKFPKKPTLPDDDNLGEEWPHLPGFPNKVISPHRPLSTIPEDSSVHDFPVSEIRGSS